MVYNIWPRKDVSLKFPHIFLIPSSAGSGKTENLANRYIQFILSKRIGHYNLISNILAITFTDNSAKDMKKRIITLLKKIAFLDSEVIERISEYLDGMDQRTLKELAEKAIDYILDNYQSFNISTIDSFLFKIFQSSSMKLNYNVEKELSFTYLDVIDDAFSYFIYLALKEKSLLKNIEDVVDLISDMESRFLINPLPQIKENFLKFLEKEDAFLFDIKPYKIDQNKKRMLELKIKEGVLKYNREDLYQDIIRALEKNDVKKIAEVVVENLSPVKKNSKKDYKDFKELVDCSKEYLILYSFGYYYPYAVLYRKFRSIFDDYIKRNTPYVILSQITREIARALNTDEGRARIIDIYIKLSAFIKHFLIDEFQDTSYSQWSVIKPLIEEALATNGTLFVIGDVKQAIYMFRNADYKIMLEFIEKNKTGNRFIDLSSLENGIEIFEISKNYRSSKKIIDYVNSIIHSNEFKKLLDVEFYEKIYNVKHIAYRKEEGYFKTLIVEDGEDIKKVLFENLDEIVKHFGYSDIAILTYDNEGVEEIVKWLNEKYPVVSYSLLDVRKDKIAGSIVSLLEFINDPSKEIYLYEFLSSGIVEIDELDDIFIEARKDNVMVYEKLKERYQDVLKDIDMFIDMAGYLGVYELVNRIYERFDLYNRFPEHGVFLLKFMEVVFELTIYKKHLSLNSFLKEIKKSASDEMFAIEMSPSFNAIKVMTFHKAKGLEFKVVINIFSQARKKVDNMYFITRDKEMFVLRIKKLYSKIGDYNEDSIMIKSAYELEEKKEMIGEVNLSYVALTRARDVLVNIVYKGRDFRKISNVFKEESGGVVSGDSCINQARSIMTIDKSVYRKSKYKFVRKLDFDNEVELRGRLYHRVFSFIRYLDDFDEIDRIILKSFAVEGFNNDERMFFEIKNRLTSLFASIEFKDFFVHKKDRIVFIEREFITTDTEILRPDRVVLDKDVVSIIDFKTGGVKSEYVDQIRKYKKVIHNAFSKDVYGYICYIDGNKIEKV